MNKETVSIIVRAILQAIAGALAARGVTIDNGSAELITGGVVAAGTVIWSHFEKKKIKTDAATQTITKP